MRSAYPPGELLADGRSEAGDERRDVDGLLAAVVDRMQCVRGRGTGVDQGEVEVGPDRAGAL